MSFSERCLFDGERSSLVCSGEDVKKEKCCEMKLKEIFINIIQSTVESLSYVVIVKRQPDEIELVSQVTLAMAML